MDPAASEFNRYSYAGNNPLRFIDPDGRVARSSSYPNVIGGEDNTPGANDWPDCVTQPGGCPLSAATTPGISGPVVSSGEGKGSVSSDGDLTLKMGELLSATIGPKGARGSLSIPGVTLKFDDKGKVSSNVRLGPGEMVLGGRIGEGLSKLGYDIKGNSFVLRPEGNGVISYKLTGQFKINIGKFTIKLPFGVAQLSGKFDANPMTAVGKWQPSVGSYFNYYDGLIRASEGATP